MLKDGFIKTVFLILGKNKHPLKLYFKRECICKCIAFFFLMHFFFSFLRKGKVIIYPCLYFVIRIQSLFLIFIVIKYNEL